VIWDYLEAEHRGKHVTLAPKMLIEKRLAEGLEDIKRGRVYGPFRSVKDLLRSLYRAKKTKTA
jgi:hypothetical protein